MDTEPFNDNAQIHTKGFAEAEALFRQQVLRSGATYQTPEGHTLTPRRSATGTTQPLQPQGRYVTDGDEPSNVSTFPARTSFTPTPEDERIIIDLDIEEVDEQTIWLRSKRRDANGEVREDMVPLMVGAPRMEHAFAINRYLALISKLSAKLNNTEDDKQAAQMEQRLVALQKKLTKLVVPDIDDRLLATIKLRPLNEIVTVAGSMVQQAMSATVSPLVYIRHVYRLVGEPHGSHDRGVLTWLREHFADVEALFQEQDDPNA